MESDDIYNISIVNKYSLLMNYVINNICCTIPKVHNYFKIKISDELFELIDNIYHALYNVGNIRKKYIIECTINIGLLDMYVMYLKNNNIISNKCFDRYISLLTDVRNIIYKWRNNEEKTSSDI